MRTSFGRILRAQFLALCLAAVCPACPAAPAGQPSAPAPVRKGYAPIHGLRMYYEMRGTGSPLLLLHGGGSTIETTYGRVLPAFAKHHLVIVVEQQGHGHTADINRPFSFEQMADDTAALLHYLKIERADVIGFSNGGNVAMQLAIRHPGQVGKLVVGSAFYRNDGIYPAVRAMFKRPVSPKDMPPPLRNAYLKTAPNPGDLQKQANKIMAMLNGFKDWPDSALQSIQSPTLIIIGDKDIIRPEHAVAMQRLLRHAQLAILPGGHGAIFGTAESGLPANSRLPTLTTILIEEFLHTPLPQAK